MSRGKFFFALALFAVGGYFLWGAIAPPSIVNANPQGETIVAFGDSLTYGVGAPGWGYPEQLSARLGIPILNRGVSGDTTERALARLQQDVLGANPKIVLLCLGGNDLMRHQETEKIFQNLEEMITRIQDRGAMVILLGMSGSILQPGFSKNYKKLAERKGCPFLPNILKGILGTSSLMSDRIHPNAEGYGKMVDRIEPLLKKHLTETS